MLVTRIYRLVPKSTCCFCRLLKVFMHRLKLLIIKFRNGRVKKKKISKIDLTVFLLWTFVACHSITVVLPVSISVADHADKRTNGYCMVRDFFVLIRRSVIAHRADTVRKPITWNIRAFLGGGGKAYYCRVSIVEIHYVQVHVFIVFQRIDDITIIVFVTRQLFAR